MKGMLIKDFSLLKGQKQFFLVVCVLAFVFLFLTDQYYFGIAYLIIIFVMFTLSTIAYDEYDNGNPFLFTLPISRKSYVREKYVFCFLISLVSCVINLILIVVLQTVKKGSGADSRVLFLTMGGAFLAGMLMMALVVPLQLKFGSEKRQVAMIAGFLLILILVFCVEKLADRFGVPGIIKILDGMSMKMIAVIAVIFITALVFISYLLSVRIMEKKEF